LIWGRPMEWRTLSAVGVMLAGVCLSSCTQEPQSATHTVAEYRANADLRHEMFARCTNDPGTLGKTPDCVNAREAERQVDIGSVRDSSPLQLPSPPKR